MARKLSVVINGKEYVSTESKKAQSSLVKLKEVSEKSMHALSTGAKAAASAFAGISAAVGAVTAATMKAAELGDNVDKMSQKIGMSRESFQEWDYILSQNGMEVDKLQTSIKTLSDAAVEAASGNSTYADTFAALGVSVTDSNGAMKDQEQLFNDAIVALTEVENTTERAALANDLFGRSATDMAPLLNAGAGSIDALKTKAHDLGLILGDDTVDASVVLTDSIDSLKRSFMAFSTEGLAQMMPLLTQASDALMGIMQGDASSFDDFGNAIGGFIDSAVNSIIDIAPKLIDAGGNILESLINGISQNTEQLGTAVTDIVVKIVDFITANLPTIIGAALEIVVALGKGLIMALPEMSASIFQMVSSMAGSIADFIPQFIEAGKNIMDGLVQGIKDFASKPVEAVKNAGEKIIGGFKNLFGIHSPSTVFKQFGDYFMQGLALGINESAGLVGTALSGIGIPLEGGDIDVNVNNSESSGSLFTGATSSMLSGGSDGGIEGIIGSLGGSLGSLIGSLSSFQAIMDPIGQILAGVMDVLGPLIDSILQPIVGILRILGRTLGSILAPTFMMLGKVIEWLAEGFVWFYNKAIMPTGNFLIEMYTAVGNFLIKIINGVISALNHIPFVNIGKVGSIDSSSSMLTAIDMASLTEAGGGASGSSYTGGGTGSSTSVQSVNITVNQTFNGNVIGDGGLEDVGEFVVSAIRAYAGVGGNVGVISA